MLSSWPLPMFNYYLTIRLRAQDFYEVIVDEGEARSNLIVLVESETKHKILYKNIEKRELEAIF